MKMKRLSVADTSDYEKLKDDGPLSMKNASTYEAQLTLYEQFEEHL